MINRTHRFHGYGSLKHVYMHGQTMRGPVVALRFKINNRRETYRAAVVVSRKVSKSAVVRNRIRRRIYETIRSYQDLIIDPYDIVFTVFNDTLATTPIKQLDKLIKNHLVKAKIISPSSPKSHRDIVEEKEN